MEKGRREIQLVKEMISGFLILYNFKLEAGLNLFTCLSCILRHRHPKKLTFRCRHFWLGERKKLCFYFWVKKNPNLLDIQEHCICKLGKIQSKLKLLFGVYYWFLKLYTGIVWHSYFPSLVWGQVGYICSHFYLAFCQRYSLLSCKTLYANLQN